MTYVIIYVKKKKFTESESKFFISCILLSLEYIHENKIIHRDIKPENLILDSKGYVHLTDLVYQKYNQIIIQKKQVVHQDI